MTAENLPEGHYVQVEVADNGCGMSPETQARIFDPFFTTKFTGRGLGLAAVLGIIRGHKGAMRIESTLGKGSTFTFILPVANIELPRANKPETKGANGFKGEGTILVADDDPNVRAVTSRMVQACGFNVLQAVDGRHAVDVFTKNRDEIRAVLLDLTMPELSGEEAFREMRRIDPSIKVVVVSGYSQDDAGGYFESSGPTAFLQKPFRPEDLNEKLRAIFLAE